LSQRLYCWIKPKCYKLSANTIHSYRTLKILRISFLMFASFRLSNIIIIFWWVEPPFLHSRVGCVDKLVCSLQLLLATKGLSKSRKVDKLFGQFPLLLHSVFSVPSTLFLGRGAMPIVHFWLPPSETPLRRPISGPQILDLGRVWAFVWN